YIEIVKNNNKAGACLIWEEAGTQEGANARKFFSDANISASSLFQTLGFKRQIALINLPCKIMLDKHVRLLVHAIIDTKNVDYNDKVCRAKFYWSRYNANYDKQFRQFHVDVDKDGSVCRLDEIEVPRAPQELIDEYNKLEFIFKRKLQDKLAEQASVAEDKGLVKQNEALVVFENVKKDFSRYWDSVKDRPRVHLIKANFNLPPQKAYSVAALMKEALSAGDVTI
ncbi:MAG: hypothetical protein KAJ10_04865, partial [Thermodesulfovibrionia bacterium]|nr:hypothetical protein [Thermodesulfovibrionia bacterium]